MIESRYKLSKKVIIMDYIQGESRYQINLFPESIDEYIANDNPVRVIDHYVDGLDIKKLGFTKAELAKTGRPPYNPKDLLKLYLYGYLNRIRSSRRLEHEAGRNLEVIWLLNRLKPDFKTIADFRKNNKKALRRLFRDFNKLCDEWELFGKEMVAIDGTKFKAVNSKKNNFDKKKIERHLKYIDEKIEKYMKELDETDIAEANDRKLSDEEIKTILEELEKRKEKHENRRQKLEDSGQSEISTTDPDSRRMSGSNNGIDMAYNVQTTVDAEHKLILDFKVTNNPADMGQLGNMALRAKELFQGKEFEVLADKGYYKADDLKLCVENGITPYVAKQNYSNGTGDKDFYSDKFIYNKDKNVYICPKGQELNYWRIRREKGEVIGYAFKNYAACSGCPVKERCTKSKQGRTVFRHVDQDFLDTIDLQTELCKDKYRLRQTIVEHPFGTIKRGFDSSYLLTRGKASVTGELSLTFLAYNLKRVINILGVEGILKRLAKTRPLVSN